jgi:acyl-CoA thioesterase II
VIDPAGDFEKDTAIEGGDGRYRATLSDAWEIWGPAGGYVSAIALRAAGAHSRFKRPASYACNYLGVGQFAPIEIVVSTLRSAKRSEVIRVSLVQNEQAFLDATVWTIDVGMKGLEFDAAPMPDVPGPDGLVPWQELVPPSEFVFERFWSHVEERILEQWKGGWRDRPPGPPVRKGWCRFRPNATFDDPFLDAARSLLLIDTMGWPAVMMSRDAWPPFVAPTIELSVRFHRLAPRSEWLLASTSSPIAADGLIGSTSHVWAEDGTLVATGGQHMLCRPAPA